MTSKPLEFHPEAEQEYLEALAWYRERSPTAAIGFENSFDRAIRTIKDAPHRWPLYLAAAEDTLCTNFPSSLCSRPSLPRLSFWQSPTATVARAIGKIACDMLKATVAMLPTDGVA